MIYFYSRTISWLNLTHSLFTPHELTEPLTSNRGLLNEVSPLSLLLQNLG